MKVQIISNGINQIVLLPETEIEKLALKSMKGKPVIIQHFEQGAEILGTPMPNAMVIKEDISKG